MIKKFDKYSLTKTLNNVLNSYYQNTKEKIEYVDFLHNNYPEYYDIYGYRYGCDVEGGWMFNDKKYCKNVASNFSNVFKLKELKNKIFKDIKPKICDIGCGVGNVLNFSKRYGYEPYGIEINKEFEKHHKNLNVKYGDVFKLNLSFLKNMDIIYMYRPIWDDELSKKLIDLIYENTNKDVIVFYIEPSRTIYDDDRWDIISYVNELFLLKK